MLRKALLLAALLAVLATAAPTPAPPPPSAQSVVVQVAASGLGDILTDGDGNTLYLFMPDNQSTPGCNAACAEAWPPLMGEPAAGAGVNSSLLGTVSRQDGTTQATYNSWPLYYFGGDPAAGDTNGQGLNEVWFVLDPAGEGVMPMADAAPSLQVASSGLGDILTDADGNTLYLFTPDNQGAPTCNDDCADAWPPLAGEPLAGSGADGSLVGTISRQDGTTQTTYNGWPLYYFSGDSAAGDTNGQGVGDVWFAIDPTGDAIM